MPTIKYKDHCEDCGRFADKVYYRKRDTKTASRYICNECMRWANIEKNYGLSKVLYLQMYNAQKGACAICKTPELFCAPVGPTKKRTLVVDHDHDDGRVRALLCHRCNTAVAAVAEDLKIAKAVARYLKTHKR